MRKMDRKLEINCDLGEGISDETEIISFIDVASIACGGHTGDAISIRKTLLLCQKLGKKAGAHPSYPDQENFGRKSMQLSPEALLQSIYAQIERYSDIANSLEIPLDHIKFHGALYNDAASQAELADMLTDFLMLKFPKIPVFVPPHSQMERFAYAKNLPSKIEIFGDRAYENDFSLVSRSQPNSLLTSFEAVNEHLLPVFEQGYLVSIDGKTLPVSAQTICFHGDNPGLKEFLPAIRRKFWK
jgi:UPF0271 protein